MKIIKDQMKTPFANKWQTALNVLRYFRTCIRTGTGPGRALFFFFKFVFGCAAYGTGPVVGKIRKGCAGINAAVSITFCRVIHITTGSAYIFVHIFLLSCFCWFISTGLIQY